VDLHIQCDRPAEPGSVGVCQLHVGHEGGHAAVVIDGARRLLRRWDTAETVTELDFTTVAASSLPWAPGRPTALVVDPKPDLAVVVGNPRAVRTAKTGRLHIA
jgi:hypothetical protein